MHFGGKVAVSGVIFCLFIFQGCVCLGDDVSTTEPSGGGGLYETILEKALKALLAPLDPIYLPFIPTLSLYDVAISFTNVSITGLSSNLEVINVDLPSLIPGGSSDIVVEINFSILSVVAGEYSAGGHFVNMPFTGESYMSATFEDFHVTVSMEQALIPLCIKENSTSYEMEIRKPVIYFDNLNPGTDQGLLFNTVISAFVPDIVDYLQHLLNGPLHELIDTAFVNVLNSIKCPTDKDIALEFGAAYSNIEMEII